MTTERERQDAERLAHIMAGIFEAKDGIVHYRPPADSYIEADLAFVVALLRRLPLTVGGVRLP